MIRAWRLWVLNSAESDHQKLCVLDGMFHPIAHVKFCRWITVLQPWFFRVISEPHPLVQMQASFSGRARFYRRKPKINR